MPTRCHSSQGAFLPGGAVQWGLMNSFENIFSDRPPDVTGQEWGWGADTGFPVGWGANRPRDANMWFWQNFRRTAWNSENFGPSGAAWSHVQGAGVRATFTARSNASWVMVTWRTPCGQIDTHLWKHYLLATLLVRRIVVNVIWKEKTF